MSETPPAPLYPTLPLRRYTPGQDWEIVPRSMASPAPDGSVAYFFDSLAPVRRNESHPFDDSVARALCRYLKSQAISHRLEISDGPYLQILEDDGSIPTDWVMLRAILWVEEYDLSVPVDAAAVSA